MPVMPSRSMIWRARFESIGSGRDRASVDRGVIAASRRCGGWSAMLVAAGVLVSTDRGTERFDDVVLACHSDQALRLLSDAGDGEREILGAIRYQPNVATLHTDERLLPRNPRARASWNYHLGTGADRSATLTYWMNQLQSLDSPHQYLVTLNRHDDIDPARVLGRFVRHFMRLMNAAAGSPKFFASSSFGAWPSQSVMLKVPNSEK